MWKILLTAQYTLGFIEKIIFLFNFPIKSAFEIFTIHLQNINHIFIPIFLTNA